MHEIGPVPGVTPPGLGRHAAGHPTQFHQIFAVGGILAAVCVGSERLRFGVMQPGAEFSGEMKSPADPDCADRIEFIGIVKDPGNSGLRARLAAETMTADGIADGPDQILIGAAEFAEDLFSLGRTEFGMAETSAGFEFLGPCAVVKQRGKFDHGQFVSGTMLLGGEHPGVVKHPERMVEIVAALPAGEDLPDPGADSLEQAGISWRRIHA